MFFNLRNIACLPVCFFLSPVRSGTIGSAKVDAAPCYLAAFFNSMFCVKKMMNCRSDHIAGLSVHAGPLLQRLRRQPRRLQDLLCRLGPCLEHLQDWESIAEQLGPITVGVRGQGLVLQRLDLYAIACFTYHSGRCFLVSVGTVSLAEKRQLLVLTQHAEKQGRIIRSEMCPGMA